VRAFCPAHTSLKDQLYNEAMYRPSTPGVILHVPHASSLIPGDLRNQFLLDDDALALELDRLTDHYTDELFAFTHQDVKTLQFPVSRFVVDPERFADDAQEPMAERGQGVIYTKTTAGDALRRQLQVGERESLLERYYVPHHRALNAATERALASLGVATIIDAHSFPDAPLSVDLSQKIPRPDICLGTDTDHTPEELLDIVRGPFVDSGYTVRINEPYAGTIVPLSYYGTNTRVSSIMIEINRRVYLDGEPGNLTKKADLTPLERTIQHAIEAVITWTNSQAHVTS